VKGRSRAAPRAEGDDERDEDRPHRARTYPKTSITSTHTARTDFLAYTSDNATTLVRIAEHRVAALRDADGGP
jgi:hypothetical protein